MLEQIESMYAMHSTNYQQSSTNDNIQQPQTVSLLTDNDPESINFIDNQIPSILCDINVVKAHNNYYRATERSEPELDAECTIVVDEANYFDVSKYNPYGIVDPCSILNPIGISYKNRLHNRNIARYFYYNGNIKDHLEQ